MSQHTMNPPADEKHVLLDGDYPQALSQAQPKPSSCRAQLVRRIAPAVILLCGLLLLCYYTIGCEDPIGALSRGQVIIEDAHDRGWSLAKSRKVELEAHIMSKCPDAKDCLQKLVVPAMEQVSDVVDFRLSYIGHIDPDSDEVHCMHGPGECLGNIIQLCAQNVYPDPKSFLGFANCMTADYSKIPDRTLVEDCAMEHGLDFDKLNDCISQEGKGAELLRNSMRRSQDSNVTTSCTIRVEEKVWCIRDGGRWHDCPGGSEVSDLVKEINGLYKKFSPSD